MSLPDYAGVHDDFVDPDRPVRFNETPEFDRGARAFALSCAVIYALLFGELIAAVIKAALQP